MEVGYGFYTIRSKLLIANDMYWIVKSTLCDGAAGRTVAGTTARHRLRNPRRGRISLNVLRDFLTISALIIKLVG